MSKTAGCSGGRPAALSGVIRAAAVRARVTAAVAAAARHVIDNLGYTTSADQLLPLL